MKRLWPVVVTQDEDTFFDDHVEAIIASEADPLPPSEQQLDGATTRWERVGATGAWIQARGGTVDDRLFARQLVAAQLRARDIVTAEQSFDNFQKTAEWTDIMDKARRLIQEGRVRILRNGYTNVVAWVKGDHGEYQPEIFRQDPNSRAITGSDCGCGWGEFQNQPRTRNWKRYQDRPCSHILAAYWQALATPLDEDALQDQQQAGGQQAPQGAPQPGQPSQPQATPSQIQQQLGIPGIQPAPPQPPIGGPSPADVLPQFEKPPEVEQVNPASVPGLRGPSPTNPINYPAGPGGALSSVREGFGIPQSYDPSRCGTCGGPMSEPQMVEGKWLNHCTRCGRTRAVPTASPLLQRQQQNFPAYPSMLQEVGPDRAWIFASEQSGDLWRLADDASVPPNVPEEDSRLTAPLTNGQLVQLRYPDTGIQQGRSEAHGAGQPTQLPQGLVGEVLGTDPTTGMVSVLYTGRPWEQNREFEPFGAVGEHWRSYLMHRPDLKPPGPAYRRRR